MKTHYKNKAFFIDRDGTINKYVPYIKDIDKFEIMENVSKAIRMINSSDWLAIVVTNQPQVAKGILSKEGVEALLDIVAPQTLTIYQNWKSGKKSTLVYNVGPTEVIKQENEKNLTKLVKAKYSCSRAFIEWHYEQLEGREFSLPLLQRLRKIFK